MLIPKKPILFADVDWKDIPDLPGVYVIYDCKEVVYVGMAGRNGKGSLRKRLKDHSTGQIVNMFAQYLFLDRVQFLSKNRIKHPREAKIACRKYIVERLGFRYRLAKDASDARTLEASLKMRLCPTFNP